MRSKHRVTSLKSPKFKVGSIIADIKIKTPFWIDTNKNPNRTCVEIEVVRLIKHKSTQVPKYFKNDAIYAYYKLGKSERNFPNISTAVIQKNMVLNLAARDDRYFEFEFNSPLMTAKDRRKTIKNISDWNKLTKEERNNLIDGNLPQRVLGLKIHRKSNPNLFSTKKLRNYANKIMKIVRNAYPELHADNHATIGEPELTISIYDLPDGFIAGAAVHYWQHGGDFDDFEGSGHFKTEKAARAANVDVDTDVSWSWDLAFDADLSFLDEGDGWQWGGY